MAKHTFGSRMVTKIKKVVGVGGSARKSAIDSQVEAAQKGTSKQVRKAGLRKKNF